MAVVTVKELVDSGVHFGHRASMWNPKMRAYIYGKKNLIHVIDLKETIRGLLRGRHFLHRLASAGAQILFVGTKRQIKEVVAAEAERVGMPVVTERWIGGTLTNYHTIRSRLDRLDELEKLESEGTLEKYSKKAQSTLRREMRKIRRNLGGVRNLVGLPGALVVIDPKHEDIAVKEAAKMNVPVLAVLDTDCNPDFVDIRIPGNDDALRSVQLLLAALVDAVVEGRQNMDVTAAQFRSEVPEIRGREEARARPMRPGLGRGPQPGRVASGRFADKRAEGPADAVSFGRQTEEELAAQKKPAAASAAPAESAPAAPEGTEQQPAASEKPAAPEPSQEAAEPDAPAEDKETKDKENGGDTA